MSLLEWFSYRPNHYPLKWHDEPDRQTDRHFIQRILMYIGLQNGLQYRYGLVIYIFSILNTCDILTISIFNNCDKHTLIFGL